MNVKFDAEVLRRLNATDEIKIETRRRSDAPTHRTTIWIVTEHDGVFIRSYRGRQGRWYREVLANPIATVLVARRRIPVRAAPETRAPVIKRVTQAYRNKYGERYPEETAPMVRPNVERTTLRLTPA